MFNRALHSCYRASQQISF